jgi:hypothetical protein
LDDGNTDIQIRSLGQFRHSTLEVLGCCPDIAKDIVTPGGLKVRHWDVDLLGMIHEQPLEKV